MTEDEAKTKWCPFARVAMNYADDTAFSANRFQKKDAIDFFGGFQCIASACMAWRWRGWIREQIVPKDADHDWEPIYWKVQPKNQEGYSRSGYCGLADEP